MLVRHRSIGLRYGFALAALAVALLARWLLSPVLGEGIAPASVLIAILATAWYGGFGPAALVSVGGPVSMGYLFPDESGEENTITGAILYFLITFSMALLGAGIAAGRRRILATAEELRTTLYSIGDAVLVTDAEGRVKSLNPVAEELTGWTSEAAVGQPLESVFVIVNEHTRQTVENPASKALREGTIVGLANHSVLISRNGDETPIDDSAAPIRGPNGKVVGVVLVFRDVTERRRAERALRRERETAHFLADASAELAKSVDYTNTLEKVARRAVPFFADWCAISMLEPSGESRCVAVVHADPAREEQARRLHTQDLAGPEASGGLWSFTPPGEPVLIRELAPDRLAERVSDADQREALRQLGPRSYIGVPIKVRGQVFGMMDFILAESNRRYDEADLSLAEDLAHRIAVAVENARLYQMLRDDDKRKDEFLAMLAHELRNPLAPIRSGLELLSLSHGPDHEPIQLMRSQVEHLVRLVDDLLDVSRIVRGKIELRQETITLDAIVKQTVAAIQPIVDARQQQLNVHLPNSPICVYADPVRLVQILENLLSNASKYTDHHAGQIELAVVRQGEDAVITVRDNGIGIEPELLPQVFELFTQSSRALDRAQGGLGIGLTLVRNLVEMHGGSVSAHSEGTGHGSVFTVRLPTMAAATTEAPAPRPAASPDVARRILVVDDNESAARLLSLLFARLGTHEVETAHDGHTALRLVKDRRPDIVLLDIGLPGMDGYELARAIRAAPELNGTLLVALTGYGQEEDRRKSRAAGFDEHLVKPAPFDEIALLLQHPKLRRTESPDGAAH